MCYWFRIIKTYEKNMSICCLNKPQNISNVSFHMKTKIHLVFFSFLVLCVACHRFPISMGNSLIYLIIKKKVQQTNFDSLHRVMTNNRACAFDFQSDVFFIFLSKKIVFLLLMTVLEIAKLVENMLNFFLFCCSQFF